MKDFFKPLVVIVFTVLFNNAFAQNNNTVTLDLKRATFKELVQTVEKQTNYYFFYNHM